MATRQNENSGTKAAEFDLEAGPSSPSRPSSSLWTQLGATWQLAFLVLGVCFFFQANAFVEEYTFSQLPHFEFGWYLTFYELICFAAFAGLERKFLHGQQMLARRAALTSHATIAAAMFMARGLTNVSLQYLAYPTQVIFKSMKLLTVMMGSSLMLGRTYSLLQYVTACLLVISAALFSLGDKEAQPNFNTTGIVIVLCSLVADAVHANTQERVLRQEGASIQETMIFTNLMAAGMTALYCLFTGELFAAMEYCRNNSLAYILFVVRAAVIFLGVLCFVAIIKRFGAVTATAVTTIRKILTILLSFLLFPKPVTSKHVLGASTFFLALFVTFYDRTRSQQQQQ